jgi:hypothetical protein
MKIITYLMLRRISILTILFLLFTNTLMAQVKIKERVEIAPQVSVNASAQSTGLPPSFTCIMPYSGPVVLCIQSFDYISEGQARLTMNGKTIVDDIWDQVYYLDSICIDLGIHDAGEVLTFKMIDPTSGEVILAAQDCGDFDNPCDERKTVVFSNASWCDGAEFDHGVPQNIFVDIYFSNEPAYETRILQPAWEGNILFKDPTLLRVDCTSPCGGLWDVPEGATFTFTITQGQEHAILYDIYSGNEGISLSGIPADVNGGWIRLKAIGDEPSQPVDVIIEATVTVPVANTGIFHITIRPNDLKVMTTKSVITYGDTLRVDIWKKLSETTYGPFESGMQYYYTLVEGYDAGYLTSPDDGTQFLAIGGDFSSAMFTAFENIPQGKSTLVRLKANAWAPAPPPPPCPDCQPSSIIPNIPLPITNVPMFNRSAGKINAVPQFSRTNSIPLEKKSGASPTEIKNKTGSHTMPVGIEKPQPASLQKNADGSYSFGNRDTTGARLSSKNFNKVIKQQADNSSQTVLRKNAYGGYSPEKTNPITSKKGSSVASTQDETSDAILAGIVTIEVVKPSDILLGETKYYTAKPDSDQFSNLIITESSSPDLGDGDERVIFEDPKIADDAVNNDSVGVYWDYNKPDSTGLDNGVIRLIGKRWKPDTTYKVKLHAVLKELGREGAVEIVVKTGCIHAAFAKTPLSIGDTTDLVFTFSDTGIPVPADILLDVSILNSDGTSGLLLPSSGGPNTVCNSVTQPIKYIAPDSIQGESLEVNIKAVDSAPSSSVTSSGSGQNASRKGSIIKPQSLSPATIKALQANQCNLIAGTIKSGFKGYFQDDTNWSNHKYDSIDKLIGGPDGRGCALCCMAMILKLLGYDVNPLTLNDWMVDKGHYDKGGGVKWDAITNYASEHVISFPVMSDELKLGQSLQPDPNDVTHKKLIGIPINNGEIDTWINSGYYIIGQVKNVTQTKGDHIHYVILTGKENNTYKIFDPGSENRTTLSSYNNEIYRAINYVIYK